MRQAKVYVVFAAIVMALSASLFLAIKDGRDMEGKWKTAMEDVKSYSEQFSSSEGRNRAFKLTVGQLEDSNDSLFKELDAARKELRIKDSRLRSLQYVSSSFAKVDTIHWTDTIFRDIGADIDTLLSDGWYSVEVGLRHPSTMVIKPRFKSVKNIMVSARRETVNPPRKFFLLRWLQRRHTVLRVDVVERNPYVENQVNRYVEIVR